MVPLLLFPFYLVGLWRWPLWDAEMWTVHTSSLPLPELFKAVADDKHPPLFFLVEWLMFRIFPSDALARLPAAVAGLAAVVVAQRQLGRHFGRLTGWYLSLLLAVSPFLLAYSANARSGSTTTLLGILSLGFALDLVDGERPRRAAVWLGLTLLAGLYVHYSMGLALAGVALGGPIALLLDGRPVKERLQRLGMGAVAVILPALAFVPWALGPMAHQEIVEKPLPRSWMVLRYLWWPVGPDYIGFGASILLGLAILGMLSFRRNPRSGMLVGWVMAALIGPYSWSTIPATLGKFYLYAPLQGMFLLLAACSLGGLTGFLGKRIGTPAAVGLVGISTVIGGYPALHDVWVPVSNLVSVSPLAPGIYDTRRDAMTLLHAPVGREPAVMAEARSAQDWLYYAPELNVLAIKQGEQPRMAWLAVTRVDDEKKLSQYRNQAGIGCLLTEAFAAILIVPSPEDCHAILQQLREVADHEKYPPFLLEVSAQAYLKRDLVTAEQYANEAATYSRVSVRPNLLLAKMYMETKRPVEAVTALESGLDRAARYHRMEEWLQLSTRLEEAAHATGDPLSIRNAESLQKCLREHRYQLGVIPCGEGLWWLL